MSLKLHLDQGLNHQPPCRGSTEGIALPDILAVLFRENPVLRQLTAWAQAAPTDCLHGHPARVCHRPPLQLRTLGPVSRGTGPRTSCLIYCEKDTFTITKQKMTPQPMELWTGFRGLGCLCHEACQARNGIRSC